MRGRERVSVSSEEGESWESLSSVRSAPEKAGEGGCCSCCWFSMDDDAIDRVDAINSSKEPHPSIDKTPLAMQEDIVEEAALRTEGSGDEIDFSRQCFMVTS